MITKIKKLLMKKEYIFNHDGRGNLPRYSENLFNVKFIEDCSNNYNYCKMEYKDLFAFLEHVESGSKKIVPFRAMVDYSNSYVYLEIGKVMHCRIWEDNNDN